MEDPNNTTPENKDNETEIDYKKLYEQEKAIKKGIIEKRQDLKQKKQTEIDALKEKVETMEINHLKTTYGDKWEQAKEYTVKGLNDNEIKKLLEIKIPDNNINKSIVPNINESIPNKKEKPLEGLEKEFAERVHNKK